MKVRARILLGFVLLALVAVALGIVGTILKVNIFIIIGVVFIISIITGILIAEKIFKKLYWYENILDCIPFPLSITDMKRNWSFVNKPVEDFLGIKRSDVVGQQCENWKAGICNTENCGINRIENGHCTTRFDQNGGSFKVDVSYLTDEKGNKVGHIEVVQDITEMAEVQNAEAELVQNIGRVSESFISKSNQVSNGAKDLAESTMKQAISTEALSKSIAEVAEKTKQNADKAELAAQLANTIKKNAERSSSQMDEMITAVNQIDEASQSISKVIKTIDDIAFQTNILALNAAVEAARAGQHGKGFIVVAEEVRELAAKSAEAAKDTERLIANSMEKSKLGVHIAEESASSLSEIVSGIGESSMLITDIASSSDEQSKAILDIDNSIEQVVNVVQQNSATAEQSAAASDEMKNEAMILDNLIQGFHNRNKETSS